MKKTLLLSFIGLILFSFSYGQTTVKGKVTDKKTGETLIGVTISLKSKPGVGVTTDLDGNFTLTLPDASVQTLVISYISYESKEEIIHPVLGEIITKDFTLQSVSTDLGAIEVQAKASRANTVYMENIKKNSASSIDFISADVMKKTGDINVTAAVTRVSGVSMNSNGFISVRGISDRYVKTTINGSRIPTLDPFTNNIKLDLFPASLIDNVILTKTATPDLPGDWAGAYISLQTKDYPDKLTVNMETSVGYNQQTSFREVLSSRESKTDWLGYDNGFREYDHNSFIGVAPNAGQTPDNKHMTPYEQLVGLGLLDYLNSIGVTAAVMQSNGDALDKNPYFILGLVQLGLLDKELQTNSAAVQAAITKYKNDGYIDRAFRAYYSDGAKSGQAFKDNWLPFKKRAPLNFSQSFSIGNQTKLFGRTLGIMTGFRYGSGIQYDPQSLNQSVTSSVQQSSGKLEILKDSLIRSICKETHTWSALMNLYYKLNINNSFTILFMPNFSGVNNVSSQDNYLDPLNPTLQQSQFYEQRKQLVYQIKSEHFIPGPQIKLELNASYTNGKSSAPDYKQVLLSKNEAGNASVNDAIVRRFRYLIDNVFDSRISAEFPLKNSTDEQLKKLKFGAAYQNNYRKSDQIEYLVSSVGSGITNNGDLEEFLNTDNFGIQVMPDGTMKVPMYYVSPSYPQNHSFGKSSVTAGYGMVDYTLLPFMRFAGGLRVEQANIYTDLVKFNAMGLAADDPRRAVSGNGSEGIANPGKLNDLSYLPSANLIFKLNKQKDKDAGGTPINLRFSFSQTVVRPSIRELSDVAVQDYEYRALVVGNPNLKMAKIKNYDIRFESYFKSGDNISVSGFYKDFKDHIEMVNFTAVTWQNVDKSNVLGIEFEGKKKIIKHLDFRANITLVKSQTIFVKSIWQPPYGLIPVDTIKRSMFGQAPYILNGMLIYTADSLGLTLALSYNVQGPKLAVSSVIKDVPDVYELPRHLLDFKVTKKLGKHWSTSLTVRDILNSAIQRAYKYDTWDTKFDSYRYGTNFVLGISYQL
jgi:hypothetical protein